MNGEDLIKIFLNYSKTTLASLYIKEKLIAIYGQPSGTRFTYEDFLIKFANDNNLVPEFIDKTIAIFENMVFIDDLQEVIMEYKNIAGLPISYVFTFLKNTDDNILLSIREQKHLDQVDQMTKASSQAYIDNLAKNNILSNSPFTVFYVDIDDFKQINDEFGSMIGDMILIEMVQVGKNILGGNGSIARVGGDRFLVMYEMTDDYFQVHDFLFEFKQKIQKLSSCMTRGIKLTVTIGSARFPVDGDNYELLLLKCKKALIRGKNKGRDCFIMYLEEKCGKVTLNDTIDEHVEKKIVSSSTKNNVYSLIADLSQIFSNEESLDKSLDDAIALVGNYFYIDRVSIARLDIKTGSIIKHHAWYNPKISMQYKAYCFDEIIPDWAEALGTKKYIRINDSSTLPNDHPLKSLFPNDNTTASLSFELIDKKNTFGLIRFDMTTGVRHWQDEDFQVFLLVSQLVTSYIQKNYLIETNNETLFLDYKYKINNFIKFFRDAGEYVINNSPDKYTIMEVDLKNIMKYRSIINEQEMRGLMFEFITILGKHEKEIIYGKQHDGPICIFAEGIKTDLMKNIFNSMRDSFVKFIAENSLFDIHIAGGAYVVDAKSEKLIDAITMAGTTRAFAKDETVCFYDEIKSQIYEKQEKVYRIGEAIENKEFLLYLQPKVSTKTKKLVGAEALTRWNYKGEKILGPDKFIPLFEEQGIIDKLDYHVFDRVCEYQKNLIDNGYEAVPISVNVSRYISNYSKYLEGLERIRSKYNVSPKLIEIEITEGMYYDNIASIELFMNDLHKKGYKISMDDFGAGYSNLISLAKLDFDVIKFDRSFCIDSNDEKIKIMLLKLVEIIKSFDKLTLCEGVETKENVDFLTEIGCDTIQGYYYSKPIPESEFTKKYFEKGTGK